MSTHRYLGSIQAAKEVLEDGIQCKAVPLQPLKDSYKQLERRMSIRTMIPSLPGIGGATAVRSVMVMKPSSAVTESASSSFVATTMTKNDEDSDDEDITFNEKSHLGFVVNPGDDKVKRGNLTGVEIESSDPTIAVKVTKVKALSKPIELADSADVSSTSARRAVSFQQPLKEIQPTEASTKFSSTHSKERTFVATPSRVSTQNGISKISSNLLKLSGTKSKRLAGGNSRLTGPKRLVPSQINQSSSDDDDKASNDVSNEQVENSKRKKPYISQTDLAYMLSWDPEAPRKKSPQENTANSVSNPNHGLGKIDEETSSTTTTRSGQTNGSHISALTGSTLGSQKANGNTTSGNQVKTKAPKPHKTPLECEGNTVASQQPLRTEVNSFKDESKQIASASIVSKEYHPKFLPLASPKNLIRINKTFYTKLGVIGKGGSCKVYRVLAPDYQIYALKKVRLEGMRTKEIESYSNEVALLKRLRGNLSIVKFIDSELDMSERKVNVSRLF